MEFEDGSLEGETRHSDDSLVPPHFHRPSLDTVSIFDEPVAINKKDSLEIERLVTPITQLDFHIQKEIEAIESFDITIQILTFKIYEATREFKLRIGEVKDERNEISGTTSNQSELSLILNNLDKKISALEQELSDKIAQLNHQKLEFQEKTENLINKLEEDVGQMVAYLAAVKKEIAIRTGPAYKAQDLLINQKYGPTLGQLRENLTKYEKLQLSGWRLQTSEIRLAEILEQHGLKFTPSARLITRAGALVTFEEAKDLGYLKEISVSLDRVLQFLNERTQHQQAIDSMGAASRTSDDSSREGSTTRSQMSSEEVKYLKQYVGRPLTLALAEITEKQPRDPIHYLGHYLFKYRYNQEVEEQEKREIEELTEQRKVLAHERWKKFVEAEARAVVLEMIVRAEERAQENELKRIAEAQMLAAAQEGEEEVEDPAMTALMEEARDKFE